MKEPKFTNKYGKNLRGNEVVFPILNGINKEKTIWEPIATAFLISKDGLFITAKHVLEESNRLEAEEQNLFCLQFLPNNKFKKVEIKPDIYSHPDADIAIGQFYPLKHINTGEYYLSSKVLTISPTIPRNNDRLLTWAYPGKGYYINDRDKSEIKITPKWYKGKVIEYSEECEESAILKGPCITTTMKTEGGVSGGPVFMAGKGGKVVGINSSGYEGEEFSFFTPIKPILNIPFEIIDDDNKREVTLRELSEENKIRIED